MKKSICLFLSITMLILPVVSFAESTKTKIETGTQDKFIASYAQENSISYDEAKKELDAVKEQHKIHKANLKNVIKENNEKIKEKIRTLIDSKESENIYLEDYNVLEEVLPKLAQEGYVYDYDTNQILQTEGQQVMSASASLGTYGDVLTTFDTSSSSGYVGGHSAIVSNYSDARTIESFAYDWAPADSAYNGYAEGGVRFYINDWKNRYREYARQIVTGAYSNEYVDAANYAENKIGTPYSTKFNEKTLTNQFYCSSLVWRAWYEQEYDLDSMPLYGLWTNSVMPIEIFESDKLYTVISTIQ